MKGYIKGAKCYIFPQTAAEIPEVEASVFYVQEEDFTAWVDKNESIADKLVKYNYNTITVNAKEWAGHTNDDLTPAPTQPTGVQPTGAQPTGAEPTGAEPTGAEPTDAEPTGAEPTGAENPE